MFLSTPGLFKLMLLYGTAYFVKIDFSGKSSNFLCSFKIKSDLLICKGYNIWQYFYYKIDNDNYDDNLKVWLKDVLGTLRCLVWLALGRVWERCRPSRIWEEGPGPLSRGTGTPAAEQNRTIQGDQVHMTVPLEKWLVHCMLQYTCTVWYRKEVPEKHGHG